jgi:hypothetical protein
MMLRVGIRNGIDHGGKSVDCARGARDEVLTSVVLLGVDTHDNSQRVILGRGGVDNLLGTTVKDGLSRFLGEENASGFADVISAKGSPADFLGVAASGSLDPVSVKNKEVTIDLNGLLGNAVDCVILVLVGHVVGSGRTSVDGVKGAVFIGRNDTGDKTSDTSESVNTHADGHGHGSIVGGGLKRRSRETEGEGKGEKVRSRNQMYATKDTNYRRSKMYLHVSSTRMAPCLSDPTMKHNHSSNT